MEKGEEILFRLFHAHHSYFLPGFFAAGFSPDFAAGLGAASFGLASGFFAMSVHL